MKNTDSFNDAGAMVDVQRYPIADLASAKGCAFAARCRREYLDTGLCALADFIVPAAREMLAGEANALSREAYFCSNTHNVYLDEGDPMLPPHDPANQLLQTDVGSVAFDRIGERSHLRRLYLWDPLKDFIGFVLGKPELHRFADVFGACSINVFVDGGKHAWHFDESEFSVTLLLQSPHTGGAFEYVPHIRGSADEKAIVAGVLDGERNAVVTLPFTAGTLLIFGGRQTLHRVTEVRGERPRLTPVLCYSETPGAQNSEAVRKLFWGRSGVGVEAQTTDEGARQ